MKKRSTSLKVKAVFVEQLFTLSFFRSLFEEAEALIKIGAAQGSLSRKYKGYSYHFQRSVTYKVTAQRDWQDYEGGIGSLLIEWSSPKCHRRRSQTIPIDYRRSNLKPDCCVPYFLCPLTGRKCRKLFTDGNTIASRKAFTDRYERNYLSHKQRAIEPFIASDRTQPYRKYGKRTYKGIPTAYGRRVQRWEERVQQAGSLWYEHVRKLLKKAGLRPPKPPREYRKK